MSVYFTSAQCNNLHQRKTLVRLVLRRLSQSPERVSVSLAPGHSMTKQPSANVHMHGAHCVIIHLKNFPNKIA